MNNIEKLRERYYQSGHNQNTAVYLTSGTNRFYFSSFRSSGGVMILTQDSAFLFVDFRYLEMAKIKLAETAQDRQIRLHLLDRDYFRLADELLKKENIKTIAYENKEMTCFSFDLLREKFAGYSFIGLDACLEELRYAKTEGELCAIREAQKITDRAFSHILDRIRPGLTERDIALELDFFMKKSGAESAAFDTIVLTGKKTSLPHGVPADIPFQMNSFITMDFGAKYGGYCSDMTRTVVLGKADEKMKEIYFCVLGAQEEALRAVRAGVTGSAVDQAARNYITAAGYGDCFGHGTGHGLGIEIHEGPNFTSNSQTLIPENAVLSVEPGIYLENAFGVRIEDLIIIKREGYENLTKSDKNLIEL